MRQGQLVLLGAVVTATCLFAKVTVDYDHKVDFGKYHTYSWIGVNVQDPAWKDITANAIDAQMAAKGWQKVASGGDMSVSAMGATCNGSRSSPAPFSRYFPACFSDSCRMTYVALA